MLLAAVMLTGIPRADPSLVEFLKSEAGCESGHHVDGDDGGECEEMEDDEP
jgi:hypothetical protein